MYVKSPYRATHFTSTTYIAELSILHIFTQRAEHDNEQKKKEFTKVDTHDAAAMVQ